MFDVLPAFVSQCISRRERRQFTVKSERYCPALLVSPISFRPMSPATDGRYTPSTTTTVMTSNLSHDDLVLPGLDLLMKYCEMCVGVGVGASGPTDSEVTGWRSNLIAPIFSSTMRTNFGVSSPLEHYSP